MVFILSWTTFDVVLDGVYTAIGDIDYMYTQGEISHTLYSVYLVSELVINALQTVIHSWLILTLWSIIYQLLDFLRDPRRGATHFDKWQIACFHAFMFVVILLNIQFYLFRCIRYGDIYFHEGFQCSKYLRDYMMLSAILTEFVDFTQSVLLIGLIFFLIDPSNFEQFNNHSLMVQLGQNKIKEGTSLKVDLYQSTSDDN